MNYFFHPEAETEFIDAIAYYEEYEEGLGYDFAAEVYFTLERITTHPKAWPYMEEGIRRALVSRFPYGILYAEHNHEIYIAAIMHLHREPGYWKHRT
jgi:hypothetical protein